MIFKATPATPFTFGGWFGDYFGPDPVGSVEMDGPIRINAIFALPARNDEISEVTQIRGTSTFVEDTSTAGNSFDDPVMCAAGKAGRTVWFTMLPTEDGILRIDTNRTRIGTG